MKLLQIGLGISISTGRIFDNFLRDESKQFQWHFGFDHLKRSEATCRIYNSWYGLSLWNCSKANLNNASAGPIP